MNRKKSKNILSVDIGGSKYIGGMISQSGEILYKKKQVWCSYDIDCILASICSAIDDVLKHFPHIEVDAVGMTIPGLADPAAGMWLSSCAMGVYRVPIAETIKKKYGYPVFIDNDGAACALAERYFGAGRNCDDYLYVTVSNGVGGAIFLNGNLYYGAYGNAGEIGELVVVENGRMSHSGIAGTLEMYAAAKGLVANYLELGGENELDGHSPNGETIATLARKGDPIALKTYELEGSYLGNAIASVYNLLDIKKVILGGGIAMAFDLFAPSLEKTVRERSFHRSTPNLEILQTPLKYEGALLGAAAVALRGLGKFSAD